MFNRSSKYVVLVIINVIVLYVLLPSENEFEDVVFDTDYVIDVLDNNRDLERKVSDLDEENSLYAESVDDLKRQTAQTDSMLKASRADLGYCENQKLALIELSEKQATERKKSQTAQQYTQQQCSDNLVKLDFVNTQLSEFEQQIRQLKTDNQQLVADAADRQITIENLTSVASKFEANQAGLLELIKGLQDDLIKPIYIKKLYVTPRYCEQPSNSRFICLEKVLVMANFSKAPSANVQVILSDSNGREIGEVSYNARNVRIVTFPFDANTEFAAGEFQLSFKVDGQELIETQAFNPQPNPS
jgi:hypothetical protein